MFLFVASLLASAVALKQLERGHVVVHKGLTASHMKDYLVLGHNFTVTYTVLNVGLG